MKQKLNILTAVFLLATTLLQAQEYTSDDIHAMDSMRHFTALAGDYYKAITYAEKSVLIAGKLYGKDSIYSAKLNNLGLVCFQASQYEKSEKAHIEAQKIRLRLFGKKNMDYVITTTNMALLYSDMGKFEQAEQLYLEVKYLFEELVGVQHPNYIFIMNNMGQLYYELGRYEEAEIYYLGAKKCGEEEKSFIYAQTLNNLGELYRAMERYEEAELMLKNVLALKETLIGKMHPSYATSLNNLAGMYAYQKRYLEAQPFFEEALNIRLKILGKENAHYAISLKNMATNCINLGKEKEALKLFTEAAEINKKALGIEHPNYASSLSGLAALYVDAKDYPSAMKFFGQAADIYLNAFKGKHPDYAIVLINIGKVHLYLNENEKAIQMAMLALIANSPDLDSSFVDIQNLAKGTIHFYAKAEVLKAMELIFDAHENAYRQTNEIKHLQDAFNINNIVLQYVNYFKNDFAGQSDKLALIERSMGVLKQGINTAYTLEQQKNDGTYIEEALKFFELNKSSVLADAVKGQRAKTLADLPDSTLLKEVALQEKKSLLQKQVMEAKDNEKILVLQAQQTELNQEIANFLKEIKQKFPKYHALKYEDITTTSKEIQEMLSEIENEQQVDGKSNKTMLLEYFVSDTVTYLFVATKNKLELHRIPITKENLKREIQHLRKSLSDYQFIVNEQHEAYELYTTKANWFYNKLLQKALEGKDIDNLILITDGELGHLPFETFLMSPVKQSNERVKDIDYSILNYLVKKYNISYNYSATLWKENKNLKKSKDKLGISATKAGQILACASNYNNKIDSNLLTIRLPYLVHLREELQPLPKAQEEITALSSIFQGLFLQNDSTNERFFKAHAAEYGIIHLAMHGILHERVPILSSLAFTENKDSLEDNFLQAYEIAHLKLNADLVVLSACETGYGKFEQGEGVISLARSFMYAGVPSLVVSLWQVNDHSTALIMQNFYQHLSAGMSKDAALREAKLNYIQQAKGIAAHPAFWSAFIQLGDNCAIKIATKTNYWFYLGIGGGVLAILGLVFMRRRKE